MGLNLPMTSDDLIGKEENTYSVNVKCPILIKMYNKSMRVLDKCDMLMELHRNDHKSKKKR